MKPFQLALVLVPLTQLATGCSLLRGGDPEPAPVVDSTPQGAPGSQPARQGGVMPSLTEFFQTPDPTDPVMYPAGEGALDAPSPGFSVEAGAPRSVEATDSGRMHLLELYQQAIDEREALENEVHGLTTALERSYADLDAMQKDVEAARASTAGLAEERDALALENAELAARLTTAQIRRLEAEKLLLEAKIELARYLEEGGPLPGFAQAPARNQGASGDAGERP